MSSYPIISNCNFESRDDEQGIAVHKARLAAECGKVDDELELLVRLDDLESILHHHADKDDAESVTKCRDAEEDVYSAWTRVTSV